MLTHENFMQEALKLACLAERKNEVPVGAIIVQENKIIAKGYNRPIFNCDPTAHAEMIAIKKAAKYLNNYRLLNTVLYVTLEPCIMCLGAILHARISHIIFGAEDPKNGAVRKSGSNIKYTQGILAEECSNILKQFFEKRR